ncbi:hypothetical protein [Acinetobacter beijerinckii]|uniref:hypothetical protein n=1 Tax=Acinetobacter beijerinckii TaxID=262668 RepID=UPI0024075690|nr:hypothetical protein [Acinetobacter beijerinckii]
MSTQYITPFREFITRDDQGRYHVRLGPQTFSTNYTFKDIRLETENGGTSVDPELLKSKPWILRNLKQEVNEQRNKERKAMYAKDCFQRTPYSANQRMAYNNTKFNKGL